MAPTISPPLPTISLDASPFDGLPRTWTVPMGIRANGIHLVDILVGPVFKSGVSGIFDTMSLDVLELGWNEDLAMP